MHSHIRVGENNKPLCELHVLAPPPLYMSYSLLMRASKLETALSRYHLYSLSGHIRYVFFMYLHDLEGSWVEAISQFHDFFLCLVKDILPHVVVVSGEVEL